MEFNYTQTNKQVQVMALRLERGGRVGRRCSHKQALPRHRAMASRPKRYLEELEESVVPTLSAMALPMEQVIRSRMLKKLRKSLMPDSSNFCFEVY